MLKPCVSAFPASLECIGLSNIWLFCDPGPGGGGASHSDSSPFTKLFQRRGACWLCNFSHVVKNLNIENIDIF